MRSIFTFQIDYVAYLSLVWSFPAYSQSYSTPQASSRTGTGYGKSTQINMGDCYIDAYYNSLMVAAKDAGKIGQDQLISPLALKVAYSNANSVMKTGPNGKPINDNDIHKGFQWANRAADNKGFDGGGDFLSAGHSNEVDRALRSAGGGTFDVFDGKDFYSQYPIMESGGTEVNNQVRKRFSRSNGVTSVANNEPMGFRPEHPSRGKIDLNDFKYEEIDFWYPQDVRGGLYANRPDLKLPDEGASQAAKDLFKDERARVNALREHKRNEVARVLDGALTKNPSGGMIVSLPITTLKKKVKNPDGTYAFVDTLGAEDNGGSPWHVTTISGPKKQINGEWYYPVYDSNFIGEEFADFKPGTQSVAEDVIWIRASDLDQISRVSRVVPKNFSSGLPESYTLSVPDGFAELGSQRVDEGWGRPHSTGSSGHGH